jgi:hypothetical protein
VEVSHVKFDVKDDDPMIRRGDNDGPGEMRSHSQFIIWRMSQVEWPQAGYGRPAEEKDLCC